MSSTDKINALITKRGQCKAKLTRFTNFISKFDESKTILELQTRLDKVDLLWSEFEQIQSEIESLDKTDTHDSERESFEDAYFTIVARARKIIVEKTCSTVASVQPASMQNNFENSSFKLPTINIPDFNGDYKEWSNFYDIFNALVENNNSLTDIQRFYYLKASLKGEAKQVIEALEVSRSNYHLALDLLRERFENNKFIIRSHVEALFNMPNLHKESHRGVRNLLDELNKHLRALKNLGEQVETWDAMLIYLLTTKLDTTTKRDWEVVAAEFDSPTISDFKTFLTNKCKVLESLSNNSNNNNKFENNTSSKFENKSNKNRVYAHVTTQGLECYSCKGAHYIYNCQDFLKLPIKTRLIEIKKKKLCTNCLKPGHFSAQCISSSCRKCNLKHNTLLHLEEARATAQGQNTQARNESTQNVQSLPITGFSNETNPDSLIVAHSTRKLENSVNVILSTAIIYIRDIKGNFIQGRALLDSGSQSNFVSKPFFERLGYQGQKVSVSVAGINTATTTISTSARMIIKSLHNGFQTELPFLVINKITSNIPTVSFESSILNIPNNIVLADPNFDTSSTVDILLGVGIFYDLLCVGQIKLGVNKPILQKSKFSWIISGTMQNKTVQSQTICNLSTAQVIQGCLERFWAIEECPSERSEFTQEELDCEKIFNESTFRNDTGRYVVTLPIRDSVDKLGDSLSGALQRFSSLEKRLSANANLKLQYCDFMQEYETLGHMTKVDNNVDANKLANYLPHHGVIKNSSITTRLRVVYDASAKTSTNISLNDILMTGPNIQDSLLSILLRFRKHNYVITADVEKMYRQIDVVEHQRDLQRVIWRNDPHESLNHYRLNTITYGTAPASFLAVRVLHQLAAENSESYPIASKAIAKDFYVDDLITGSDTINNTLQLQQDISDIFSSAGMTLRKWKSNESRILNDLNSKADKSQYYVIDDSCVKTLGVLWKAKSDTFQFTTSIDQNNNKITKRSILSTIARMFDPLGILGPVIIKIKIILQVLWQLNLQWDESLPTSLHTEWIRIRDKINLLSSFEVSRHVMLMEHKEIELHGLRLLCVHKIH